MAILASDTASDAERVQVEIWRSMSPLQKAQLTGAASRAAIQLALAGIRKRHPGADSRELAIRFSSLTLGPEATRRIYPDATEILGL